MLLKASSFPRTLVDLSTSFFICTLSDVTSHFLNSSSSQHSCVAYTLRHTCYISTASSVVNDTIRQRIMQSNFWGLYIGDSKSYTSLNYAVFVANKPVLRSHRNWSLLNQSGRGGRLYVYSDSPVTLAYLFINLYYCVICIRRITYLIYFHGKDSRLDLCITAQHYVGFI